MLQFLSLYETPHLSLYKAQSLFPFLWQVHACLPLLDPHEVPSAGFPPSLYEARFLFSILWQVNACPPLSTGSC